MENRQRTGHPSRTRVQGPLAAHADGFRREMTALGYSETQVREHVKLAAHLSSWLEGSGLAAWDLTIERIAEFLDARSSGPARLGLSTGRGLAPLLRYLRALGVAPEPGDQIPATPGRPCWRSTGPTCGPGRAWHQRRPPVTCTGRTRGLA